MYSSTSCLPDTQSTQHSSKPAVLWVLSSARSLLHWNLSAQTYDLWLSHSLRYMWPSCHRLVNLLT